MCPPIRPTPLFKQHTHRQYISGKLSRGGKAGGGVGGSRKKRLELFPLLPTILLLPKVVLPQDRFLTTRVAFVRKILYILYFFFSRRCREPLPHCAERRLRPSCTWRLSWARPLPAALGQATLQLRSTQTVCLRTWPPRSRAAAEAEPRERTQPSPTGRRLALR